MTERKITEFPIFGSNGYNPTVGEVVNTIVDMAYKDLTTRLKESDNA